jgi:hypothetical protein
MALRLAGAPELFVFGGGLAKQLRARRVEAKEYPWILARGLSSGD